MSGQLGSRELPPWLVGQTSTSIYWSQLSDAQRATIYFIVAYFVAIFAFWNGLFGLRRLVDRDWWPESKWASPPILWPFKILTVLIHEMGHAVVGCIVGFPDQGVRYIHVDVWEGGDTGFTNGFKPDWRFMTSVMAGYTISCFVGCGLVFCGFDALYSKYASLALGALLLVTLFICIVTHDWVAWKFARIFRSHEIAKAKEKQWRADRSPDDDRRGKAAMMSLDIMMSVSGLFLIILFVSWYLSDSIALRFVILFMGEMSALYAIWDIVLDGLRSGADAGSDITEFVRILELRKLHKKEKQVSQEELLRRMRPLEKKVAVFWLLLQITALILAIILGLRYLPYSFTEQALRARSFLPSPNHWEPADTLAEAKAALQ
ncbi:hypothetical protein M231_02402 [Tremella mesenterica]|uniref:Uncharacterized protein n=1 Tax=Tremella mesenterica TaxID=5217 RepID=A0A4Q1BQS3_TREME|nr:hypothetical protein M231_02402 [Tremella mesenterica]